MATFDDFTPNFLKAKERWLDAPLLASHYDAIVESYKGRLAETVGEEAALDWSGTKAGRILYGQENAAKLRNLIFSEVRMVTDWKTENAE